MSYTSKIEWTETTWNPVTGCTKVSEGCRYCYAERLSVRLKAMKNPRYLNGFDITLHNDLLSAPLKWHYPRMVFVNSMSDLFHENIPLDFIRKVFEVISICNDHTFQILTKRSERLYLLADKLKWPSNLWMGVTVESEEYLYRIDHLINTPAKIKFISFEPLLSCFNKLDLEGIDWVIVGGESGPNSRPMNRDWVIKIKDRALKLGVPFFFKQWGGKNKKKRGRLLDGYVWNEMPKDKNYIF